MVIAPARKVGDPGSIPGPGENFSLKLLIYCFTFIFHHDTSTPTRTVDNVVITTKGLQERNIHTRILDGTTVENKGKSVN